MSYYKIATDCPTCGQPLTLEMLGIGVNWALAVNWRCDPCKTNGGLVFDLCELTLAARRHEAMGDTVH